MHKLVTQWAGRLYGTNTGNLFIELQQDNDTLSGTVRFMDSLYGLSVFNCSGTCGDEIRLLCVPVSPPRDQFHGDVTVEAFLTPEGNLRGNWSSTIGTAGTFEAYPHDISAAKQSLNTADGVPEQIYNKNIRVGSIRLFTEDVKRLISFIQQDFRTPRSVVTFNVRGSQATKYSDDFLREVESLGQINYLKISIQEPEAHGINRIIVIELLENGQSEIRVSGINEAWVVGKAESIAQFMRPKENTLVTTYIKYGLNLNSIVFFVMLIAIPEVRTWQDRGKFVFSVFALLNVMFWLHSRFIRNTVIYLTGRQPSFLERNWPTIVSWSAAATSSLFASWVFYVLTKGGS